jgi:bifunctional DNase/RNase
MLSELIQLSFDKIMQTNTYTVIILSAEGKRFAIYTEPSIGRILQMYLTETERQRPLTFDLIDSIFHGLNITVQQVVIDNVEDTIYFAKIFLEQTIGELTHILEIDARPSDCITLALMNDVPVFCTRDVLEKTISVED